VTEQPNPLSDSEMEPGGLPAPIAADGDLESGADPDGDPAPEAAAGPADGAAGGPPSG